MPASGRNCTASSPNCPSDSSGDSAACMPRARLPSAISPSPSQSQGQPSIAHSIGVIPLAYDPAPYRNRPDSAVSCSTSVLPESNGLTPILIQGLLRSWCHRTGERYRQAAVPLSRLRAALSLLSQAHPPFLHSLSRKLGMTHVVSSYSASVTGCPGGAQFRLTYAVLWMKPLPGAVAQVFTASPTPKMPNTSAISIRGNWEYMCRPIS